VLPKVRRRRIDLGFLSAVIIGAFAGSIAPYSLGVDTVIAAISGYVGMDAIENLVERAIRHRGETT